MSPQRPAADRTALRQRLLAEREAFVASPQAATASQALQNHLVALLGQLVPECLGVYWPVRSEFNAAGAWAGEEGLEEMTLALPFAQREPAPAMHYRRWDGATPTERDPCGIFTASGGPVVPDVVLVPCVGFTAEGYRLGYGGGFFDRYLAAHPDTTAIGIAWSFGEIAADDFAGQAHDRPLTLVVTERGVAG